jgi:hypothetical protein
VLEGVAGRNPTRRTKIARKADFNPSPPSATSARDAKAQKEDRVAAKERKDRKKSDTKNSDLFLCTAIRTNHLFWRGSSGCHLGKLVDVAVAGGK